MLVAYATSFLPTFPWTRPQALITSLANSTIHVPPPRLPRLPPFPPLPLPAQILNDLLDHANVSAGVGHGTLRTDALLVARQVLDHIASVTVAPHNTTAVGGEAGSGMVMIS